MSQRDHKRTTSHVQRSTEALTTEMIAGLRAAAGAAGDQYLVQTCDLAMAGNPTARQRAAKAISDARGMDDAPFVRVVAEPRRDGGRS